jgi:predicted phage terminase large subunit-like protein
MNIPKLRRTFTAEFKARILAEVEGGRSIAEVRREYALSPNAIYEWRIRAQAAKSRAALGAGRWMGESDYCSFLRETYPKTWSAGLPHIALIAKHLDAVERGEIDRLAIHMPPRHSKTETATVRYAAYCAARRPADNVLVTGYNAAFARRLSRKARNVAVSCVDLDDRVSAADEWATSAGGVVMARGVGSPPTGTGFGRIIIDDPIRRHADAESAVYRERVWDWYTDDLYTRLEPRGAIVLVMTLWHEDDLGARAVASEPDRWTVLKLPALAEEDDPVGRQPGEALWPDRFDVGALARIRDVMRQNEGERSWLALYQQRPTPREGLFFKVGSLDIVPAAPARMTAIVRAWDMASSVAAGAYTAGVKMASDGAGTYYILDVVRGQWSTDERDRRIRQTAMLDGRGVRIRGPQDPGAAGVQAAQAFVRLLAGFSVRTERVTGDKETRADPLSSQVNAGNVKLVKGDWNLPFIEELRQFPSGRYKDQVDAAADAFVDVVTVGAVGRPVAGGRMVTVPWALPGGGLR